MASSNLISPSEDFDEYASLSSAEAGLKLDKDGNGASRLIVCVADGILQVKRKKDAAVVTLTVKAWVPMPLVAIAIVASGSSGCVPIQIYR